jgi:hypothetical protein
VVSGEAIKPAHADDRAVDAPGSIVVTPSLGGVPVVPRPAPPVPARVAVLPEAPRRGGAWLVVLVYILAAAALGYAIWERFLR